MIRRILILRYLLPVAMLLLVNIDKRFAMPYLDSHWARHHRIVEYSYGWPLVFLSIRTDTYEASRMNPTASLPENSTTRTWDLRSGAWNLVVLLGRDSQVGVIIEFVASTKCLRSNLPLARCFALPHHRPCSSCCRTLILRSDQHQAIWHGCRMAWGDLFGTSCCWRQFRFVYGGLCPRAFFFTRTKSCHVGTEILAGSESNGLVQLSDGRGGDGAVWRRVYAFGRVR